MPQGLFLVRPTGFELNECVLLRVIRYFLMEKIDLKRAF